MADNSGFVTAVEAVRPPKTEELLRLYLVRHASPDWERRDLPYDRPPGPPLTALGEAEAARLGEFLHKEGVRNLWVSPMQRCLQTAEIAAEVAGAKVHIEPGLIEWRNDEDRQQAGLRLWAVWEQAVQSGSQNGPLALITHGSPVKFLLTRLGLSEKVLQQHSYDHGNPLPPAGVWLVQGLVEDSRWQLDLVFTP